MRQRGAVAREMSSGNQVRVGQWGATSRTCSSSSLSLHSVCASRLTGGNAYLRKARGQLCASASVPRGPSVREKYLLAVYRGAMPTSGPGSVASAEVVSYEAIRAAGLQLRMPYAPGASETVSVVPHSCL